MSMATIDAEAWWRQLASDNRRAVQQDYLSISTRHYCARLAAEAEEIADKISKEKYDQRTKTA